MVKNLVCFYASQCTNALEFGPCDFATGGILTP